MPSGESVVDPGHVHPWIRLWARSLDVALVAVPIGFAWWQWYRPEALGWFNVMLFGMLVPFVWLLIEPVLISRFATTPGKWVFSFHVTNPDGSRLSFMQALRRADMVWAKGLGAGTPLIGQLLMAAQHYRLSRDAKAFWDEEGPFEVHHGALQPSRIIGAIALLILALVAAWLALTGS
jgi:hypothetical protein